MYNKRLDKIEELDKKKKLIVMILCLLPKEKTGKPILVEKKVL